MQNGNYEYRKLFINRELSWLEFNKRVLNLSKDNDVPLAERVKFLCIYYSNLDEFFMVRVGSLYDRALLQASAFEKENKTRMTPQEQIDAIIPKVKKLQVLVDESFVNLTKELSLQGYKRINFENLTKEENNFWKKYFLKELFPILSPQIIDRRHPFPFLRNNETYLGATLSGKGEAQKAFGIIPISTHFGKIIILPQNGKYIYTYVEDLILNFAQLVFGKKAVKGKFLFRVTRNADITADDAMFDQDLDYRVIMGELLKKRRKLAAVRLQVNSTASENAISYLCEKLLLPKEQVFSQIAPLELSAGFKLTSKLAQDGKTELFYAPKKPIAPKSDYNLKNVVQETDVLLQYPYQSIRPFLSLLVQAANDPEVVSIKMTLYRVADNSKIIEALCTAAENGKEIVTVVELRARFDEQNNIEFSKVLEDAGCTVIYGFGDYKVHTKLCLITKKSHNELSYISQIGTGNYNEKTSEQYTDLSFITSDKEVGIELAGVFNDLAMERLTANTSRLLVAPLRFKNVLMQEMQNEIDAAKQGRQGKIVLKCNSISDKDIIEKISEASNAGVKIYMIVRGICCLKAGVLGLSENVKVRSLVGRYLEHSRIYSFGHEDNVRVYIASGDFLTRNTQRRVEAGVRITDSKIVDKLQCILNTQLDDNVNSYEMNPDGTYKKIVCTDKENCTDAQSKMYEILAEDFIDNTPQSTKKNSSRAFGAKIKMDNSEKQGFFKRLISFFKFSE